MDQIFWCKFFALIIGCFLYTINPREGEIFILKQKYYEWDKYFEIFQTH
jgi:hypothetical protein